MINVTKAYLPPIDEYVEQLKRIWENEWLTNRGTLVLELEEKLKTYLKVSNIILMNNGTIPLQIALRILGKNGEIITTPFSYVATTSAIVWENCKPIFVDIHPEYLTIDESKIEEAITAKTTCILATHVFGNPCNVERIEAIAKKFNLMVIYDAAHAFNVDYKGKSIFDYGDVSTSSFHATKLFQTAEGGALFCNDEMLRHQMFYSHNFGHNGPLEFHGLGINGKISELHAAMGLTVLNHLDDILERRKQVIEYYNRFLNFDKLTKMKIRDNTNWNYSYYPILFRDEEELLLAQKKLNSKHIFPRRYFYPSLNNVPFLPKKSMPISDDIASRILCLPLYVGINEPQLAAICKIINSAIC